MAEQNATQTAVEATPAVQAAPVAPVSKGPPKGVKPSGPPATKAQKKPQVIANKAGKGPTEPKMGRRAITSMTEKDKSSQIKELLAELRSSADSEDKKRIRRLLRARGHYGGLGENGKVVRVPKTMMVNTVAKK